jgi:NodT family efflux transporter outer membrane factor (OMF) lipoprotein
MTFPELLPLASRRAGIALGALFLAGCAVGPEFVAPDNSPALARLQPRATPEGATRFANAAVPAQWWTLFNDPVLSELQARASSGNLDLQIASERIEQSRAQLGVTSADALPRVDATGSVAREAISANGKFAALGAPTRPSAYWQLGFDASWEIDLWGRARRARERAAASLEATVHDRDAARVALAAEVARTYLALRGAQARLDTLGQNLRVAQRLLGLAESRERNGIATRFETSSSRAQVATIQASLPGLSQRRNVLMNALALLLGEQPRALDARLRTAMPLPSVPANLPVGIPSELAHRRPDILRAEAQLHAAVAGVGVATADFYPRIGLRGRVGVEAFDSADLASWDSRFFSIGPTVYLPIFQGGRLQQRLALSESKQRAAALAYRRTVLRAWHEVDDALDGLLAGERQHALLRASLAQNQDALHVAERSYRQGATDYVAVLTAQRSVIASQGRLDASATETALAMVNLYKSLGGGWEPDKRSADSQRSTGSDS